MKPTIFLFLLILFPIAHHLYAQSPSIERGDRVRIILDGYRHDPVTGVLVALTDSTITLQSDDKMSEYPLSDVSGFYRSLERRRHGQLGVVLGGVGGALIGGLIGNRAVTRKQQDDGSGFCSGRFWVCHPVNADGLEKSVGIFLGAAAGAAIGGVLGYTIGHSIKSDRWERVQPGLYVGMSSLPGGDMRLKPSISLKISLKGKRK